MPQECTKYYFWFKSGMLQTQVLEGGKCAKFEEKGVIGIVPARTPYLILKQRLPLNVNTC